MSEETTPQNLFDIQLQNPEISTSPELMTRLPEIKQFAQTVKQTNDEIENALQDPTSDIDEASLQAQDLKKSESIQFIKEAMEGRKKISSIYNSQRDATLNMYDELLNQADFETLTTEDTRRKKLTKDIRAHKINKHWEELKQTFDKTLELYPNIQSSAPNLARFSTFRITHPKLVNGQKSFKITDRIRGIVSTELAQYSETIDTILQNPYQLNDQHVHEMLRQYEGRPDSSLLNNWAISFQQQEKLDAEREAKALERKKQQEAAQSLAAEQAKQAQEQAASQAPAPEAPIANASQATPIVEPAQVSADPYKWVVDYSITNRAFANFHDDPMQAINLVQDLIAQLGVANSPVMENVKSPDQMKDILKYVLD